MELNYLYSPHCDFYIDKICHEQGYYMKNFHIHHKYEIYFAESGTRRYFIEDSSCIVHAGDVILIGCNQFHKTEAVGNDPSNRIVVNFSDQYLKDIQALYPKIDFTTFLNQESNHLLTGLSRLEQHMIALSMNQLVSLNETGTEEAAAQCKLLLACLLLYLKDLTEKQKDSPFCTSNTTNPIIREAQAYISEHYHEALSLNSIAAVLYISPSHLSRLFKRSLSIGIVEYIQNIRIKAAQDLLEHKDDSITTISEKTGFSSPAHFRRTFKDVTGITPQKYRSYFHVKK